MMPQQPDISRSQTSRPRAHSSNSFVDRPLFLVGSERSGTTLLRLMLDHHPRISFFFEFQYAVSMMPEIGGWPDLKTYHQHLRSDRIFGATLLTIDESLDYPRLIDSFLRQKRDRDGKPLVGATVHYEFDRLLRIWPDARFIHLVRDGRDVARSVIEMGWAGNTHAAVDRWIMAETLWSSLSRELPPDRRMEVKYEDLIGRPRESLMKLCEWIGVPYDPEMLNYPFDSTYRPPSPSKIDQWKTKLTPAAIRLAESRIGPLLLERGYELSGHPPLEVTPMMAMKLNMQDRWYRATFRRKRYGTMLWCWTSPCDESVSHRYARPYRHGPTVSTPSISPEDVGATIRGVARRDHRPSKPEGWAKTASPSIRMMVGAERDGRG